MVKCADCGYLGVRHVDRQILVSPSEKQRQTGQPETVDLGSGMAHCITEDLFVCAMGTRSLYAECEKARNESGRLSLAKVLETHGCEKSVERIPALTPKEHIDMLATREMLDSQNARVESQAEREREWRREDVRIAADTLRAARGNTLGVWVGVIAAIAVSGFSLWWTITHTPPTLPPQTGHQTSIADP